MCVAESDKQGDYRKNKTRRLRMHDRISQNKVSRGREQRGSQPPLTCFLSVHWVHKFRLDDTVRPSRQTGCLQDRSRRLKQDSWLWCQLFSLVTGEHDGQLDCCSAQYFSSLSLAAQTAALLWFDWKTSIQLICLFIRLVLWTGKTQACILRSFWKERKKQTTKNKKTMHFYTGWFTVCVLVKFILLTRKIHCTPQWYIRLVILSELPL